MQDDDDSFDAFEDLIMAFRAERPEANDDDASNRRFSQETSDPRPISIPDLPELLTHTLRKARDVNRHISSLRDIAMYLLEEADKLQARSPANFHVSDRIH